MGERIAREREDCGGEDCGGEGCGGDFILLFHLFFPKPGKA